MTPIEASAAAEMSPLTGQQQFLVLQKEGASKSSKTEVKKSKSFPAKWTLASALSFSVLILAVLISAVALEAGAATTSANSTTHKNAINYLLYSNQQQLNQQSIQDSKLRELLTNANHNHASDAVNLELANSVWAKMRDNVQHFAVQQTQEIRPTINRLLEEAKVSNSCKSSLNNVLDRISKLDNWAIEMYNAFGNFPAIGLFEGTRTSMGSYHQCVNLEPNEWIGKPQYCTFKFQPVVPKRPKYHNILATIDNLANFTSKNDMFHHFAKKAQYYYYTKMRLATCMPSKCERSDFEQLGKQIALNTYLQFAGVSCLEKEEGFNLDAAQVFAVTILLSLASISFLGTLVHLFDLRSFLASAPSSLCSSEARATSNNINNTTSSCDSSTTTTTTDLNRAIKNHASILLDSQQQSLLNGDLLKQQAGQQHTSVLVRSESGSSLSSVGSIARGRLLTACDFLMHFSIIKNGRKLFDTSTSRGNRNLLTKERKENSNEMSILKNSSANSETSASSSNSSSAVSGPNQSSDISCVHGLRFWTISWIILGHTMQYTEWAGFGRTHEIEQNITSFWLHPVLNATFSVDTFFLISGLLTTYVTWSITRGQYKRFNKFAFLISRYLRLTPQVLLVILLFIVFPLMGDGPYWRGLIQKESDNCKRNWWVNALYLQSFVKQDQICNLVTWWLSIEMFYHLVSIFVIIGLLKSTKKGLLACLAIGGGMTAVSCYLHFVNHYPPNMLPTLLQRYEIWDSIVLKYFWTPYPHAASYFVGLLLGYILYNRSITRLSSFQVRLCWLLFVFTYLAILFGTYKWNKNAPYSRITSTVYYNSSQVLWSFATAWAIFACASGYGGWLNSFLSSPVFIPLGRATYMTYLSHMIIVMSYPAKMNMLIEPTYVIFLYIFISNLFLSYLLGIILTLVYESPILHLQKVLVASMAAKVSNSSDDDNSISSSSSSSSSSSRKIHNHRQLNRQAHHQHHPNHHHQASEMVKVSLMAAENNNSIVVNAEKKSSQNQVRPVDSF